LLEISLVNGMRIRAILEVVSKVNLLAESVYEELVKSGVGVPHYLWKMLSW
jgi:hypothetical protein